MKVYRREGRLSKKRLNKFERLGEQIGRKICQTEEPNHTSLLWTTPSIGQKTPFLPVLPYYNAINPLLQAESMTATTAMTTNSINRVLMQYSLMQQINRLSWLSAVPFQTPSLTNLTYMSPPSREMPMVDITKKEEA
eukprot:TRINITY_DN8873_c0_g1_i3.p1 TRINITY_DN8873_c0_g1~~TRINITY_DN8873_c0_g1_i3.p1  ORF type:complete len:137 (+),score=21.81 TRINITY_DN8873_c0_g1_i3:269-679(+)